MIVTDGKTFPIESEEITVRISQPILKKQMHKTYMTTPYLLGLLQLLCEKFNLREVRRGLLQTDLHSFRIIAWPFRRGSIMR